MEGGILVANALLVLAGRLTSSRAALLATRIRATLSAFWVGVQLGG
jgi:hypothetical protein